MTQDDDAWIQPRPIRIAFLVADDEYGPSVLDAVFQDCHSRWGGRFSLIAPCQDGKVNDAYWPWLAAFDADLIYSYVSLAKEALLDLKERLGPAEYVVHPSPDEDRRDARGYRPDYRFKPLAALSTVFRQARQTSGAASLTFLDLNDYRLESRFLTDNFGKFDSGQGGAMIPADLQSTIALRPLSPPPPRGRELEPIKAADTQTAETLALNLFASGEATSMSVSSLLYAPKLEFGSRWGEALTVVVGDSFADRIVFWNARLHIPAWLDTDAHCLRVSEANLADDDFVLAFLEFLKRRNRVSAGGGQTRTVLRSACVSAERLEAYAKALRDLSAWNVIQTSAVSIVDVVPAPDALHRAREGNRFGAGFMPRPNWTRFDWRDGVIRPPTAPPDHLAEPPPGHPFARGYWASDIGIASANAISHSRPNRWWLPVRWPMSDAFDVTYVESARMELRPRPRQTRGGALTTFVSLEAPVDSIKVPDPESAIRGSLVEHDFLLHDDLSRGQVCRPERPVWAFPSNEARYLNGVTGLMGGLGPASQVLLHPFLADVLATLGGSPAVAASKNQATRDRLAGLARTREAFNLADPRDLEVLADLVVRAASGVKSPGRYLEHAELQRLWKNYRERFWADRPMDPDPADAVDWDAREVDSLDACLVGLRRRKILIQGHSWTCQDCHHRNWVGLEQLSDQLTCDVCGLRSSAPVSISWRFRPNPFLIESLRDHSVLSVVWALNLLAHRAQQAFAYAGPTGFHLDRQSVRSDAEADLLVVCDGRTILCEVKSSWSGVRKADVLKLTALAVRLRPDVAMLAVMDEGKRLTAELDRASAELALLGIEFELLLRHPDPEDHSPYLPEI